jgi:hypothetical protein
MAGNEHTTPILQSQSLQEADEDAGHTRPAGEPTPTNMQRTKRHKNVEFVRPPPGPSYGKEAATTQREKSAREILEAQGQAALRQVQEKLAVMEAIGTALDSAVASFAGPEKRGLRLLCRDTVNQLLSQLNSPLTTTNAVIFAAHDTANNARHGSQQPNRPSNPPAQPLSTNPAPSGGPNQRIFTSNGTTETWSKVAAGSRYSEPASEARQNTPRQKAVYKARKDNDDSRRVLIRIHADPLGSPPQLDPFAIRRLIASTLKLDPSRIPDASKTNTGYSVLTKDSATRDLLLDTDNAAEVLRACGGVQISAPEHWHRYAVKEVPSGAWDPVSRTYNPLTLDMVYEETRVQAGATPRDIKQSRHGANKVSGRSTYIISFLEPVGPFRLFSSSERSKPMNKKPMLQFDHRGCQGYCNPAKCTRAKRCYNCGDRADVHDPAYVNETCPSHERCANCYGPDASSHSDCPAKPTWKDERWTFLSRKARATVRAQGNRRFRQAHDATEPHQQASDHYMEEDTHDQSLDPEHDEVSQVQDASRKR